MTESQIWIITGTLAFSCIFGPIAIIKLVKQYTRTPVNVLTRRGDIKLGDFIEPTRPQRVFNYPDLFESQVYDRIPTFYSGNPPSYISGTPPSYYSGTHQIVDRGYIHSCLENCINLDYIYILLILTFLLILIKVFLLIFFSSF